MGEHSSREIKAEDGHDKYLHALGTSEYLKIDKGNMIYYHCQFKEDEQIWIQDQYFDNNK